MSPNISLNLNRSDAQRLVRFHTSYVFGGPKTFEQVDLFLYCGRSEVPQLCADHSQSLSLSLLSNYSKKLHTFSVRIQSTRSAFSSNSKIILIYVILVFCSRSNMAPHLYGMSILNSSMTASSDPIFQIVPIFLGEFCPSKRIYWYFYSIGSWVYQMWMI